MQNRRRADRLARSFPVRAGGDSQARAIDVSRSGVRIELNHLAVPGSRWQLFLETDGQTTEIEATVAWSAPSWREGLYQVGLQLSDDLGQRPGWQWLN